jgi:hypothetical protein
VNASVEAKLSAIAGHFAVYNFKAAEKASSELATSDWANCKDFVKAVKILSNLGLIKSSQ